MNASGRPPVASSRRGGDWNVPNVLSALRFPLAVLFPFADYTWRIVIVIAAAFTDWIDGQLARRTDHVTRLGEVLDPIADKTFMAVALITLVADGLIPLWTLPLLLLRDIGVAIGALALVLGGLKDVRMPSRLAGKLTTWIQFGAIAAILIRPSTAPWAAPLTGIAGLVALIDYIRAAQPRIRAARAARGG